MSQIQIPTDLIHKFTGRIHAVNLIGELSMRQNGRFDITRGKERAERLIRLLEAISKREKESGTIIVKSMIGGRELEILTNRKERLALAKHYCDSEEARKLCSVTSLKVQEGVIKVVRRKIATGTFFKKNRYQNSRAKAIAALQQVAKAKTYKELPKPAPAPVAVEEPRVADAPAPAPTHSEETARTSTVLKPWLEKVPVNAVMADITTAMALLKEDLDMASDTVKESNYLLINKGDAVYCVTNEIYIESYRQVNSLPKTPKRICGGGREGGPSDTSAELVGKPATAAV